MPFNRDVKLTEARVDAMTAQLRHAAHSRTFVCASRESLLSLKLKAQVRPAANRPLQAQRGEPAVTRFPRETAHAFATPYAHHVGTIPV